MLSLYFLTFIIILQFIEYTRNNCTTLQNKAVCPLTKALEVVSEWLIDVSSTHYTSENSKALSSSLEFILDGFIFMLLV
ncbi:hypothetical protein KDW_19570 [Dictyobacter vulcani]|uniref:Uncharacterized protein n=1 Tax=Dictyobacter vulcani TaxID=2607529 RepID=A0A5J4KJ17_9CHLR|nr:hypothetical protein KDW_19570 [Dictyobacter vulcani]